MAFDNRAMSVAKQAFQEDKEKREAAFLEKREIIFRRIPRLREIDIELRKTLPKIIAASMQKGSDPSLALKTAKEENLALQRERAELLVANGYPSDALEEKPKCPICNDTGFSRDGMCVCLKEYYKNAQIKELSKMLDFKGQSFEQFSFEWYDQQMSYEAGNSPRENMEKNYDTCQDYAHTFGENSENLLLSGEPGLGKTFLSTCIAKVVSESGFSVVYDTARNIFEQFENQKFYRDEDGSSEEDVQRYLKCDLLIMDDLGTEMTTSFIQSVLYRIVNDRLMSGKKTIISTNLSPVDIGTRYTMQVQSRIEGEYRVLPFFGEDIRRLKAEKENR